MLRAEKKFDEEYRQHEHEQEKTEDSLRSLEKEIGDLHNPASPYQL